MDRIIVRAKGELNGSIPISGAKNAALPLMIASLLTSKKLILENVPRLADVASLMRILTNHGTDHQIKGKREGQSELSGQTIVFKAKKIIDTTAPYELVSKMRASFWVIGPLLARMGEARVSLPGGCAIGTRPVDLFIESLEALGATIKIENGYAIAKAPEGGLVGTTYRFPKVSVGATHVMLMAATLAKGTTVINNAAREPEVVNLVECLNAMGAKITGQGTRTLTIEGVEKLHGATHRVVADRIEAGTYAMAVAMTGGDVTLTDVQPELLKTALDVLVQAGITIERGENSIRVVRKGTPILPVKVSTEPHPGFPTDLQAQLMALMVMAEGTSEITETIFENRFMHVSELARLGAQIALDGQKATITGVKALQGAPVMATDLRASVSLVIAGLVANGDTEVHRVYHLDRGFENLEEKFRNVGGDVERVGDEG